MQVSQLLAASSGASSSSVFPPAVLALADGTVFHGISIGAEGQTVGEVVFNTAMTGYQEILTDPSYCRQIVTLTYPHIGNTGWNTEDNESSAVHAAGLVVRDLPQVVSNFRSEQSLDQALKAAGTVAIAGLDTRALTRRLRDGGAQAGAILAGPNTTAEKALQLARSFAGLVGADLAKEVTTGKPYSWTDGTWQLGEGHRPGLAQAESSGSSTQGFHVVAYDFGVKRNILRLLADRGARITVVPAQTSFEQAMALKPDGLFLSNGPGDPEPCDYAIAAARQAIEKKIPLFGICLGHQILALAAGAKTIKMKFGHHGANHPVQCLVSKRVFITSQNHGFAVDPQSLPAQLRITHVSLFDGSIQGLEHTSAPAYCFQGHPEASPGPHDIISLFDRFFLSMKANQGGQHA
ncbi:MAG: glutamine-hydrolyzing carbamoyl-phosphate synthase small subunit [Burkholderiaceae bacterium]